MKPSKIHLTDNEGNEIIVELGDRGTLFVDVVDVETDDNKIKYQFELSGPESRALQNFINEVI